MTKAHRHKEKVNRNFGSVIARSVATWQSKTRLLHFVRNDRRKTGFSLLELLVVLVILGFLTAMMAKVFTHGDDQKRFDETRTKMEEIKKALIGTSGAYANGQRQFAGYITDMGRLPELNEDNQNQPDSLWIQENPMWKYDQGARIWMGWRGPYIETPQEGLLEDAWGDTFAFEVYDTGIDIISRGADNNPGGSNFNEDITLTIRKTQYRAPVAGRVKGTCNCVKMCFPDDDSGDSQMFGYSDLVANDSYFRFEDDVNGDSGVPVGVRSIVISDDTDSDTLVFTIEPTGNWLGNLIINE